MKGVMKRLANLGFTIELTERPKFIADKGYDSQFGAGPLHQAIQKYLKTPGEEILNMSIKAGDIMIAELDESGERSNSQLSRRKRKRKKSRKYNDKQ